MTIRAHVPEAVLVVMLPGQLNVGSSVSLTLMVNEHALVLPLASVAVQLTVVTPLLKLLPLAGRQATAAPGQLSLAVGVV